MNPDHGPRHPFKIGGRGTRWVATGCIASAGLILAAFWVVSTLIDSGGSWPKNTESPKSAAVAPEISENPIPSPANLRSTRLALGLRPGERLRYGFSQSRKIRISNSDAALPHGSVGAAAAPVEIEAGQSGDLVVDIFAENEKGWIVGFRMQNADVRLTGGSDPSNPPHEALNSEMQGEVLAVVNKSGRIEKLVPPASLSPEAKNHWRDILSRWQVILPDNPNEQTWHRTEEDTTGSFLAVYTRHTASYPESITKQKHHYLRLNSTGAANPGVNHSITGSSEITLSPFLVGSKGRESLRMEIAGIGSAITSECEFNLQLQSAGEEAENLDAAGARLAKVGSAVNSMSWSGELPPASQDGSAIGESENVDVPAVLNSIKDLLAAEGERSVAEIRSMEKLYLAIKRDDGAVDAILDALTDESQSADFSSILIGALGAAGTPAAQTALLAIATSEDWLTDQREMALFSFAQVIQPIPEVDSWLQQLHIGGGSLANSALLVLSAMGDRIREADPARHATISRYILEGAAAGPLSMNDRIVLLDAIGNLGPAGIPGLVIDAARSEDALLRQRAIQSLQRIESDRATVMIAEALRADESDAVRSTAAKLLGNTARSGGEPLLSEAVIRDRSEEVRREALIALSEWAQLNPETAKTIRQVSAKDSSAEIRQLAAQLLSDSTATSPK
jgi:HEAT repeat protein